MRNRLIELLLSVPSPEVIVGKREGKRYATAWHIADHLLANGVIVPPVRVGQTVWGIRNYHSIKHPQEGKVSEMYFTEDMRLLIKIKHICIGEWGKTVFLTREAAEQALKGGAE
jgi:hypothetical protein